VEDVVAPAAPPESTAPNPPLLVVLLGATGSGKTALSLALAERFDGEILSCDSVAVYRGMDVGAAKPTLSERARIPHHLLDIADPGQPYSAGDYGRDARQTLAEITARGRLPIVVGGTGLYLRALLCGLFEGPKRSENLRERLRRSAASRPAEYLWRLLQRIDPISAARIHANDTPKLIRAIEVTVAARQPMSAAWQAGRDPLRGFRILRIGLDPPRQALYARINQRAAAMFTSGLMEETAALLAQYGPKCAALGALGYKQAAMVQRGEMPLAAAIAATQQGHRNYAKRQMTWFRREPDVVWLSQFGDEPEAFAVTARMIAEDQSHSRPLSGSPIRN
jgi:tRNA dimethylallyltransferase